MEETTVRRAYDVLLSQARFIEEKAEKIPGFNKSTMAQLLIGMGIVMFQDSDVEQSLSGGTVGAVMDLLKHKAGSKKQASVKRRS